MNHETLRVLFEWLCDHLEDDSGPYHFHFQGGFGLEFPHGVVMIFVFDDLTLVCRFSAHDAIESEQEALPLSSDTCLQMVEEVRACKGGFQELFTRSSQG